MRFSVTCSSLWNRKFFVQFYCSFRSIRKRISLIYIHNLMAVIMLVMWNIDVCIHQQFCYFRLAYSVSCKKQRIFVYNSGSMMKISPVFGLGEFKVIYFVAYIQGRRHLKNCRKFLRYVILSFIYKLRKVVVLSIVVNSDSCSCGHYVFDRNLEFHLKF